MKYENTIDTLSKHQNGTYGQIAAQCTYRVKIPFIVPTDAHYYKIVEMLKHLKL